MRRLGRSGASRRTRLICAIGLVVPAAYVLPGGAEAGVPQCDGVDATIVGSNGKDNISGTPGDDVIVGLGGNDRIRGEGGDDLICGGDGNDDINGGDGDDHVLGEAGRDDLQGGDGNDRLEGGDGNDSIKGGDGDDVLLGQGGNKNDLAGGMGVDSCDVGDGGSAKQCENFPPAAIDDGYSTDEDTPLSVPAPGVLANDTDPDGDTLSVSAVDDAGTIGVVTLLPDGSFTYDPNGKFEALAVGESATDTFTYDASDGILTDTATVTITIAGVNDPPVAVDDAGAGFGTDEDTAFTTGDVLANDTDPDASDVLSVASVDTAGTVGSVVNNMDGTFSYDPNGQFESLAVGDSAIDVFTYTVSDGNGGTDTATVTITIAGVNDPPVAVDDAGAGFGTDEDTAFTTGDVLANDTDPDASDVLSVASVDTAGTVGSVVNNMDGTFSYDPNGQFESLNDGDSAIDVFTYTVSDGNGGTDTATVTITIQGVTDNFPPEARDDDVATDEDTLLFGDVLADNGNGADSDPDGDPIIVISYDDTATAGLVAVNLDGTFSYDPNGQFESLGTGASTTDSFEYTISDPLAASDTATVTITILGVDDPPVAVDDTATVLEDSGATTIDVLANDLDVDGGPITISSITQPANGTVVDNGTDVTYEPDTNYCNDGSPTDDFSYTVAPGGSTATVSVTVACDDDAPVAIGDTAFANEDEGAVTIDVLANDIDVDGGPITISSVTQPANGVVVDNGVDVSYEPDTDFCGGDVFTYALAPGGSTATVRVTVTCIDDPPLAVDDSATVAEDDPATSILVLANDTDIDGGLLVVESVTQPANGTVVGNGVDVSYEPDPDYCNDGATTDDFTYTLNGGSTATVRVTVTCVPDPPLASDDGPAAASSPGDDHHTALDTVLTVVDGSSEDLLVNDVLGVPAATLVSFGGGSLGGSVTDHAAGATVGFGTGGELSVRADGTYTFTPSTGFTGLFTFRYRLDNGDGTSDATVTIAVGVRPSATPDALGSIGNVGITASGALGVLANDLGDQLAAVPSAGGTTNGGSFALTASGEFSYRPPPGFEGVDSFVYSMGNGFGSVIGLVNITVDDVIWFVDNAVAPGGNGTLTSPFDSLAAYDAGAADEPGDIVFVEETGAGSYSGGITLLAGQQLIGNGSTDSLADAAGITVPPASAPLPATNGDLPTIADTGAGHGIQLAAGNTVRGLNVVNSGGGSAILGTGVGTLSISDVDTVTSTGGPAISISGGTWNIVIGSVSVPTSASSGLVLSSGPGSTATFGNVAVTTTGGTGVRLADAGTVNIVGVGSTVSSTSGRALDVTATGGAMAFASLASAAPAADGIRVSDANVLLSVSGTSTVTDRGGTGIVLSDVSGFVGLGATTVGNGLGSTGDGVRVDGSSATFVFDALNVSGTVVGTVGTYSATTGVPTNDGDGNGVFIKDLSGSFTVNGGTIHDFADNAIDIRSSRNVTLSGVTIDGNFAGNSAVQGHDVFNFSMVDTTIDDLDNVNAAALVGDHGLRFTELEGTVDITGASAITDVEGYVYENASIGSANRAIEVQNRQGCMVQDGTGDCNLTVVIDGLTVRNFDFQGVSIRHVGGTTDVTVRNSAFAFVNGAAIDTGPNQASTTNTHDLDVSNNRFTDVGIVVEAFSGRGGPTTAVVSGNVVTRTHGDGIRLVAFNQAGAGPTASFTGTVSNNTMTGVAGNAVASASGGAGVFIAAEDGVDAQVLIENNAITGHTGTAPVAECLRTQNQRDGVLDVVFRNNSCIDFPSNFFGAVFLGNDFDTTGPAFTDTCVDFAATNTYSNTDGVFANTFATDSTGSSIMDLPNGFNSAEPVLDFGNPPTAGACSIAPLS